MTTTIMISTRVKPWSDVFFFMGSTDYYLGWMTYAQMRERRRMNTARFYVQGKNPVHRAVILP